MRAAPTEARIDQDTAGLPAALSLPHVQGELRNAGTTSRDQPARIQTQWHLVKAPLCVPSRRDMARGRRLR